MEREKEAAAAASAEAQPHSVTLGSGRQTDDEDEGDDAGEDEDDIDDSRIDQDQTITLNSSTVARRRYIPSGSSTSATTTSNVAAFSPYMTTTMTTMRPPFGNAYSRGTVAPNEGSYAAVTGVIPLLSQIPLPPASFGIGMASSASSVRYGANPSSNPNEGPFSAYAPQNESGGSPGFNRNNALMGFGNTRVQTGTDMNIGSASSMWSHATSNRTSTGESATGVATASSKRKRRTTAAQNNESLTAVREQHPGTGVSPVCFEVLIFTNNFLRVKDDESARQCNNPKPGVGLKFEPVDDKKSEPGIGRKYKVIIIDVHASYPNAIIIIIIISTALLAGKDNGISLHDAIYRLSVTLASSTWPSVTNFRSGTGTTAFCSIEFRFGGIFHS